MLAQGSLCLLQLFGLLEADGAYSISADDLHHAVLAWLSCDDASSALTALHTHSLLAAAWNTPSSTQHLREC